MREGGGQAGIFTLIIVAALVAAAIYGWADRSAIESFVGNVLQVLGAAETAGGVTT
jgi:hypothetical protein